MNSTKEIMYWAVLILGASLAGGFLAPPGEYGLAALYGGIWGALWFFIYYKFLNK